MTTKELVSHRLASQHLLRPLLDTPEEVVSWLGAVQAQDYQSALWAIGIRMNGSTESIVEKAIDDRKIVRSWPMRGTLHIVSAEDLRWMLKYLTPRVVKRTALVYRQSQGLSQG
jgi:hypothetical protein